MYIYVYSVRYMRKIILLFFFLLSCHISAYPQFIDLNWVKGIGGNDADYANDITIDLQGNIIVTGGFTGTADFDPGTGVFNMTASGTQDVFIAKYSKEGLILWAKKLGGNSICFGRDVKADNQNNIYFTVNFQSSIDIDPGPGTSNFLSLGFSDVLIVKFDPAGNLIWGKQIGGSGLDDISSIELTNNSDVILVGSFRNTIDIDPGAGVINLSSAGVDDGFVLKLSSDGNFIWGKQIGGVSTDSNNGVSLDAAGSIFITGTFSGLVDFDPDSGVSYITANGLMDAFILKLNSSGSFIWVKQAGGTNVTAGVDIDIDRAGNIFLTAGFYGMADFDPGPGVFNLTTRGQSDIAVYQLNSAGDFIWAGQIGGTGNDLYANINIDNSGNFFFTGVIGSGLIDLDPTAGFFEINTFGSFDGFISAFDSAGNFISGKIVGGANTDWIRGSCLDSFGNIHVAGSFTATADFNKCDQSVVLSGGISEIFIAKFLLKRTSVTINTTSTELCEGDTFTFNAVAMNGGSSVSYKWQVNGINVGADLPVFISNTLNDGDSVRVVMTSLTGCILPKNFISNMIEVNIKPYATPSVNIALFPSEICYGTVATFVTSSLNGGSQPAFQWRLNGSFTGHTSSSYINSTLKDGDEVDCIMRSNYACLTQPSDTSSKIIIRIDPRSCPIGFYMPTAFTPNNDGRNDLCQPKLFGRVIVYRFSVYNRWGQKLFETTNPHEGWDGKIQGNEQPSGTFAWSCIYQLENKPQETRKGTITLIK